MPALQVMWRRCHFIISIRLRWFAITGFSRGFFPIISPISEDVFGDVTMLPFDPYRKNSDIITGRHGVQVASVSCACGILRRLLGRNGELPDGGSGHHTAGCLHGRQAAILLTIKGDSSNVRAGRQSAEGVFSP